MDNYASLKLQVWLNTENTKGIGSRVTFLHGNNLLSQKAIVGQLKNMFFHTSFQVSKNMSWKVFGWNEGGKGFIRGPWTSFFSVKRKIKHLIPVNLWSRAFLWLVNWIIIFPWSVTDQKFNSRESWSTAFLWLVNLMTIFPWNMKSKFNFCRLWSSPVMKAVFGLYLAPLNAKFLRFLGVLPPGPPPECCPGSYGHCISCLRHDNHSIRTDFTWNVKPSKNLCESWKTSFISRDSDPPSPPYRPLKCMHFLSKAVATHAPFLLALANHHPQSCFATEVEGGCTCSQVSRWLFCNTVPAILLQNLPLATCIQHSGLTIRGTSERSVLPVK